MNKKLINDLLFIAIDSVNESRSENEIIKLDLNTKIYGKYSSIDSLALINLLVSFEEQLSTKMQINIDLFDEISNVESNFSTLNDLAQLTIQLLNKKK